MGQPATGPNQPERPLNVRRGKVVSWRHSRQGRCDWNKRRAKRVQVSDLYLIVSEACGHILVGSKSHTEPVEPSVPKPLEGGTSGGKIDFDRWRQIFLYFRLSNLERDYVL